MSQTRTSSTLSFIEPIIQLSGTSPVKKNLQNTIQFAAKTQTADDIKIAMAEELEGLWLGPMPIEDFLREFVPQGGATAPPVLPANFFSVVPTKVKEKIMCQKFIDLINDNNLLPGFRLLYTGDYPDQHSAYKIRPDVSTYTEDVDTSENPAQVDKQELPWEFKNEACDPFNDSGELEPMTLERKKCRGQIARYLTEVCARQHRTHAFLIFVSEPSVRFVMSDRSGGVVTECFNFREMAQPLVDFLWYFAHLSPELRGYDITVSLANIEEGNLAKKHLSKWRPKQDRPVLVFKVPELDGQYREVIGWGSMSEPASLTGRATRGYPVYDTRLDKTVFMKDSWRSLMPGMEKEAAVLKELNEAEVRNVPTFLYGNDLPRQTTPVHALAGKPWNIGGINLTPRVHNRFITDFVGMHLDQFTSTKQLIQAVYDAFVAHQDAVEKCRILHRDVSGKNVMMTATGNGILNDWDQARRMDDKIKEPRQYSRSGTWQFMSISLLSDTQKRQDLQDDFESFFYVILYHVLRYTLHTHSRIAADVMHQIFDSYTINERGELIGGVGKSSYFAGGAPLGLKFQVIGNLPLTIWLMSFRLEVKRWLEYLESLQCILYDPDLPIPETIDPSCLEFYSHGPVLKRWKKLLDRSDWPLDDGAKDQLPKGNNLHLKRKVDSDSDAILSESSSKRSRSFLASSAHHNDTQSRCGTSYKTRSSSHQSGNPKPR